MNPTVSEQTRDYDRCAFSIVVRTARELQRELLNHYAAKSESPDPAICFYLGLNYMSENLVCRQEDRNWELATKWLQKAAKSSTYAKQSNSNLERIRKYREEGTLALKPTSFSEVAAAIVLNAMNSPQETLELGSVDFSNRKVTFKLPLYNSLHWLADPSFKSEEDLTTEEILTSAGMAGGTQGNLSSISEWMSRTSAEVTSIKPHLQTEIAPEHLIRIATVAGFKSAWPEFWAYKLESGLRKGRKEPETSKLSLSRFEKKYADWIWNLAWLRFSYACSTNEQQIMDLALQTLNIAYKQTERHNPRAHRTLYLAWTGYIYFRSERLDDLLYYPYNGNMLPTKLPCQAVLDYASRMQAIQKLERPQLTDENVIPVVHHPRQKLLFGDGTIPGTPHSEEADSNPPNAGPPAQATESVVLVVPMLVLGLGALIVLASVVIMIKRRGDSL
jgi:hypothetical protein